MSLHDELEAFLHTHGLALRSVRRLGGGASQEIWLLRVAGGEPEERNIVLRRDAEGTLSTLARTRFEEYALMQAVYDAGVPVPKVLFCPLQFEGRDAFFMEHVEGETIGRRLVQHQEYAQTRASLPAQVMRALVDLHAVNPSCLPCLGTPQTALDLVEALEHDLDVCDEGHPALELGLRWLRTHAPPLTRSALVHGDFRMGNFVVGPDGLRAVLDWELAHLGDPDEDLGWFCVRAWRFGADRLAAGGVTTRERLLELHLAAGGHDVTAERLRYWEIFGNVKWGIVALSQAGRHLRGNARNVELAVLGRTAAETEREILHLLSEEGA